MTFDVYVLAVESFTEVQDSLCVAQKSRDGGDERVVLFLKMAAGTQLSAQFIKQVQASIRRELSARHVPAVILQTADIPVRLHTDHSVHIMFKGKGICTAPPHEASLRRSGIARIVKG